MCARAKKKRRRRRIYYGRVGEGYGRIGARRWSEGKIIAKRQESWCCEETSREEAGDGGGEENGGGGGRKGSAGGGARTKMGQALQGCLLSLYCGSSSSTYLSAPSQQILG